MIPTQGTHIQRNSTLDDIVLGFTQSLVGLKILIRCLKIWPVSQYVLRVEVFEVLIMQACMKSNLLI